VNKNIFIQKESALDLLFKQFIENIKSNDIIDINIELNNCVDIEIIIKCQNCNFENNFQYLVYFSYRFYVYINEYIECILDNIIGKYLNMKISEIAIEINRKSIDILFENLPQNYKNDICLIKKLLYTKNILLSYEGKGSDEYQLLGWLFNEFKVQIFGIILSLIIAGGIGKIKDLIKNIKIKHEIRKRIIANRKYWKDIDIESLKNFITIPKDFAGSKEELIEDILKIKYEEYKNEIIEKIRSEN